MIQGKRYNSLLFRIVNKLTRYKLKEYILKYFYSKKDITALYNVIMCEVHRENFLFALTKKIEGENNND